MEDKPFTFLLEAYKTSIDYFTNHADRTWTRFNILISIDLALAGLFGGVWFNSQSIANRSSLMIPVLGLLISLILYIQSAQDKYVLIHHLKRINEIRKKIEVSIGRDDIPALFSPMEDTDSGKRKFVFQGITSWRSSVISLTSIPPITSLVFVGFWGIALFL